jgi:hypothetical protein
MACARLRIASWRACCAAASLLICSASAFSQPVARISVGSPVLTMKPDLEVPVPVNINAPGEGLVRIAVKVGYPAKLLEYVSAKPGAAVERAKATVRVQKAEDASPEEQVLSIEIDSPQPLTAGTLVTLHFNPSHEITVRTEVPIRNISRSARSAAGQDVAPQGSDGKVTLTPMVFSCFFYMH